MAEQNSQSCEKNSDYESLDNDETDKDDAKVNQDDQWQAFRPTIRERTEYMFRNSLMSDTQFSIRDATSDTETETKVIPAHKFVLAVGSPVFYAMFYGKLAESQKTIEIVDSDYQSFIEFLRFLYCDETNLTIDMVMAVTYLSKKYIVPALEKRCRSFVEKAVSGSNVFQLLSHARKYKDDFVEKICWDYLDSDTVEAINSEGFLSIKEDLLCELLIRDTLHAKEIELFLAVVRWIDMNALVVNNEEQMDEKKSEKVVNLVRYPLMSQHEFAEHVVKSKLLRHEDVINMFLKFNDTLEDDNILPFSQVPRRGYYRCSLWEHVYDTLDIEAWDIEASRMPNTLTFSSNSNILLCGVGLYGSDNKNESYSFQVHVSDEDETVLLQSEGSFSCHNQCFAYDVIFNKPVKVHKNIWYTIHATVDGPRGVYGGQSVATATGLQLDEISCGSVRFLFKDNTTRLQNMYNHFAGLLYFLR